MPTHSRVFLGAIAATMVAPTLGSGTWWAAAWKARVLGGTTPSCTQSMVEQRAHAGRVELRSMRFVEVGANVCDMQVGAVLSCERGDLPQIADALRLHRCFDRTCTDAERPPRRYLSFRVQAAIANHPAPYRTMNLVQAHPEPIGGTVDAIRAALWWLGKCSREQAGHSMHLMFKFTPEIDAQATLKLKVEINTREHASLLGVRRYPFAVESDWYRGTAEVASFEPEELFGTKLRALLQRRRNRDLFDLHQGLEQLPLALQNVVACFHHYLTMEGKPITRAMAEQRMLEKLTRSLTEDVAPMLPASVRWSNEDAIQAFERVWAELIARMSGDAWKLSDAVIEELRAKRYPALLMPRDRERSQ